MVLWPRDGTLREALILERDLVVKPEGYSKKQCNEPDVRKFRYYVHYTDFNRRMDEWISFDSFRTPLGELPRLNADGSPADETVALQTLGGGVGSDDDHNSSGGGGGSSRLQTGQGGDPHAAEAGHGAIGTDAEAPAHKRLRPSGIQLKRSHVVGEFIEVRASSSDFWRCVCDGCWCGCPPVVAASLDQR